MTDVRALLREQRAARQINHPYATYSVAGKLSCSACQVQVKPESQWDSHLRSSEHIENLKLAQKASERLASRKRKANDEETHNRKKSKSGIPAGEYSEHGDNRGEPAVHTDTVMPGFVRPEEPATAAAPLPAATTVTADPAVDEDEWAAFERDVATPPPEPTGTSALTSAATISAQPLTAEELRAQAQEAETSKREQREAEMEAEKEDATRALEDEFDEMDALEQRVKRLREQREALRKGQEGENGAGTAKEAQTSAAGDSKVPSLVSRAKNDQEDKPDDDNDDDDDDDDDDDGEWNLWKT